MRVSDRIPWEPVGDRTDKVGRVIVRVILSDGNVNVKGNLTRTFSVHGATVTEVAQLTRGACQALADKVRAGMESEAPGWGWTH